MASTGITFKSQVELSPCSAQRRANKIPGRWNRSSRLAHQLEVLQHVVELVELRQVVEAQWLSRRRRIAPPGLHEAHEELIHVLQ